jgi:hypothetical protein
MMNENAPIAVRNIPRLEKKATDSELRFDRWQFYRTRRHTRTLGNSEVDWSDYQKSMSMKDECAPRRNIPAFALDDEKLRLVIIARDAAHMKGNFFSNSPEFRTHHEAVKRAGSYRAFIAAIAFRAWRQGLGSVEIASLMGISPQCVRQHLCKMTWTANKLLKPIPANPTKSVGLLLTKNYISRKK